MVGVVIIGVVAVGLAVAALRPQHASSTTQPRPVPTFSFASESPSLPPLRIAPAGSNVLFFGDSWTGGRAASTPENAYTSLVSRAFEWAPVVDAWDGTGYITVSGDGGPVYIDRISSTPVEPAPKMIILQGGLNDTGKVPADYRVTAEHAIQAMMDRFPGVPVVVVGPSIYSWPVWEGNQKVDTALRAASKAARAYYVSPLSESWIDASNIAEAIDPVDLHPNDQGHALFAEKLVTALEKLTGSQ